MILNFQTDRYRQTVQTQIRLLLEGQSDQVLHCLLFHLHVLTKYLQVWPLCLKFRCITAKFLRKFTNFTVNSFRCGDSALPMLTATASGNLVSNMGDAQKTAV